MLGVRTPRARRNTLTLLIGVVAFVVAMATPSVWANVTAEGAPESDHPQDWVDPSTGQIDPDRVPDRVDSLPT